MSSATCMNRFSKMVSRMVGRRPRRGSSAAIHWACMSVGKPGWGTGLHGHGQQRTAASQVHIAPGADRWDRPRRRWWRNRQPRKSLEAPHLEVVHGLTVRDGDVAAGGERRRPCRCPPRCGRGGWSGVCAPGRSAGTPSTSMSDRRPSPLRCARPWPAGIDTRSTTSGSRAALWMTGDPVCQDRRHQDVLGPRDSGEVEVDVAAPFKWSTRAIDVPARRARRCSRAPRAPSGAGRWDAHRWRSLRATTRGPHRTDARSGPRARTRWPASSGRGRRELRLKAMREVSMTGHGH